MALNKQIWLNTIVENFYPDNSFASKSIDDSTFVSYKTVHIPNAGTPSGVEINRTKKPASVSQRTDNELTYDMDELTTNPIYIPNIDTVELSYDKRNSVLSNDRQQLQKVAAQNLLYRWAKGANTLNTSGAARKAHTSETATGKRKKFTKAVVMEAMVKMNVDDVPTEGRYMLLDAVQYADLLDDLTDKELSAFQAVANVSKGVMGQLYGFSIMQRSKVLRVKADGSTVIKWEDEGEATELAAGLAWQQQCVSRALGEVKMFSNEDDPQYYGDIYSFLVRVGGSPRRYDNELTYDMDELTTNPIYIPNIDTVELSYDKRNSVLSNDRQQLQKVAAQNLLYRWAKGANTLNTSGAARKAHTSETATGKRKKFTKAVVMEAMVKMNVDDVPTEGRYMLLDAVQYADLLDDLTDKELSAFQAVANVSKGVMGQLYGFSIMQRSKVLRVKADGSTVIKWEDEGEATELAAGLAWQQQCVSRALGEVKMFSNEDDPQYYGDIYSFLVRVGGSPRRYDKKGVYLITEGAVA